MISVRSEKFKTTRNTAISAQVSLHSLRIKTNNEQGKSEKENSLRCEQSPFSDKVRCASHIHRAPRVTIGPLNFDPELNV